MGTKVKANEYLAKLKKAVECKTGVDLRYQIGKANNFCIQIEKAYGKDSVPKSLMSRIESYKKQLIVLGANPRSVRTEKEPKAETPVTPLFVNVDFKTRLIACDTYAAICTLFEDAKAAGHKLTIQDTKRNITNPETVEDISIRLDSHNREIIDFILADKKKVGYYVQSKTMPAKKFITVSR